MSGLFGVFDSVNQLDCPDLIQRMADRLCHFPWHNSDLYQDPYYSVSLGRIGIGVFNAESQPLISDDKRLVCFFSGEIDGAASLRRELTDKGHHFAGQSDAEVILRLFEDCGERFIDRMRGSFVAAIWDTKQAELTIVNDRFGTYPLYYAHFEGKLIFAPEIKAVLTYPDLPRTLDLSALAEYIRFQAVLGATTFFEEVKLLRGGSVLIYRLKEDQLVLRTYWDFSHIRLLPPHTSYPDAVIEAARLLKQAVQKYPLIGYKPGLLLSGGLDSRMILGVMGDEFTPLTTVTYGLKGCKDVIYAEALARQKSTNHHFFEFRNGNWVSEFTRLHLALAEANHSWIHSHGLNVADLIRGVMNVNYSGFAGDLGNNDLSLYYPPDAMAFQCRLFDLMCADFTWPSVSESEVRNAFLPPYAESVQQLAWQSVGNEIYNAGEIPFSLKASAMCLSYDMRMYFQYVVCHRAFFEERLPFLDYDYFDFTLSLPPEFEYNRRFRKSMIVHSAPELARVPHAKDDLPITGNWRRSVAKIALKGRWLLNQKFGGRFTFPSIFYADYEGWLRNELKNWAETILFGKEMRKRAIFNLDYLKSIWGRLQSGREDNLIGKIAPFMSYEMMIQALVDDSG